MAYTLRATSEGLCVYRDELPLLANVGGFVEYPGTKENMLALPCAGAWQTDGERAFCDNMTVEIAPCGEGVLLRAGLTNTGESIAQAEIFTALSFDLPYTIERALITRPFVANQNVLCEMRSQIDTVRTVYNAVYESVDSAAFDCLTGGSFVFGAVSSDRYFPYVTLSREGHMTACCRLESHPLPAGETVYSEWFCLLPCDSCLTGQIEYAQIVARLAGLAPIQAENPSGFCTWYYYLNHISPACIRDNMRVLSARRDTLPVRYMQIDDGWFVRWGDWTPNQRFGDISALAAEIKAAGFRPGLWFAPFGAHPESAIVREHPDWFVRTRAGESWQGLKGGAGRMFSVDFTHPEALAWLRETVRRMTWDWGFEYLKIDIISDTIAPGVHYDENATALENMRIGMRAIREAAKPGTFILGCTAPFIPSCALVDGMRVSCDIFERWQSLRDVFNSVLKRYHFHRNLFLNDADCLIIRKKENEDGECMRPCTRSDREIRAYVTAMAASGGALMLSDKLKNLSEAQLQMLETLFPLNQQPALPLDLMDSFIPGVLDFGWHGGARTVAVINWGDSARDFTVPQAGDCFVLEFWDKDFVLHHGGDFIARLQPHEAKVFFFTPVQEAAVIGSSAALVMQTDWLFQENTLRITRLKKNETVYLAVKGAIPRGAAVVGCAEGYACCTLPLTKNDTTLRLD